MPTSLIPEVLIGAVAPEAIQFVIGPADLPTVDLSTVTGGEVLVRKPDGTKVTWSPLIIQGSPTTAGFKAYYAFASGDVDQLGEHRATLRLAVPGGFVRCDPQSFCVVTEFGKIGR